MFFVLLQFMMKSVFMKISAVVLVLWYCMSVIGFNVHTCNSEHHGHECSGMCCSVVEHDHHGCCSSEADDLVIKTVPCCSDDFQVLYITGACQVNEERNFMLLQMGVSPYLHSVVSDVHARLSLNYFNSIKYAPDSGHFIDEDVQSVFNIWRI